jgi:hypothetical protein
MHIKKLIFLLIFTIHSNAMSLEIPIFTTQYFGDIFKQGFKNKEQCLKFTAKVDGQLQFVDDICNAFYSSKASEVASKRLLCMRRNIENASTVSNSRLVIFKCFESFHQKKHNLLIQPNIIFQLLKR